MTILLLKFPKKKVNLLKNIRWTMSVVFVSLQLCSVELLCDNWKFFFDNKKFHALTENHGRLT